MRRGVGDFMSVLTLPYNFTPRDYQLPFLQAMDSGYRRAVCCWHRRSGKDKTFINFVVKETMRRVGLYAYLFPTYKQGRKVLWNGMDREGFKFMDHFPAEIVDKPNDTEMRLVLKNGSIFQIFGTDDIDAFMGANPVGCVFSEYSLQIEGAWDHVRPILRENGGWAVFNLTPRGRNHAFKLAEMARRNKKWFFSMLTVRDTKKPDGSQVITPAMIREERAEGMSEAMIQQEYFCSFESTLDACFFGDSLAHHTNIETGVRGDLDTPASGETKFVPNNRGVLEVWEHPYRFVSGWDGLYWKKRYSIGSDIGEGLGRDFSVAHVYDRQTNEFVARMRSNKIDAHHWGDMLHQLSLYYDGAIIVPERTGAGITTCKRLVELRANVYRNLVLVKVGKPMTQVIGWVETKQAKYNMAGDLREYFANTTGRVRDSILLQEAGVFVVKENKRLGADDGFNDDCVISAGLAIQGSYFLAETPKVCGEAEFKEKKRQEVLDKLDGSSRAAVDEYAFIVNQLREAQEAAEVWL